MTRLPGDPGALRWLAFAYGFRLPPANLHWVRHELTDAGWRGRTIVRHLAVIVPVCGVLVLLLAEFLLILIAGVGTVAAYADDIRAARLRQHGLPVPNDPDLGRPTH